MSERNKSKLLVLSYGWARGDPPVRRYRIESIANTTKYHPRDFLTDDEVETLCNSSEWQVQISAEDGREP